MDVLGDSGSGGSNPVHIVLVTQIAADSKCVACFVCS